jgi:hypothetical protein
MTREEACELYKTGFWEYMSHEELARFQLAEPRLCMPFDVFHEAVEKTLGRPVYTHEFISMDALRRELSGDKPPPRLNEIMELIPEEKRILLLAPWGPK